MVTTKLDQADNIADNLAFKLIFSEQIARLESI